MLSYKVYDCVIVGAGPSGLTAANLLTKTTTNYLIIEKGKTLFNRDTKSPKDIVTGIGGGGLFSDGKVSFYPSGTNLYKLNPDLLIPAYKELQNLFANFDITIPEFNPDGLEVPKVLNDNGIIQKKYDSIVMGQDMLYRLGFYLYDNIPKKNILVDHTVQKVLKTSFGYTVKTVNNADGAVVEFHARKILFSSGKFSSLSIDKIFPFDGKIFKKIEFGIRIETEPRTFDYKDLQQTDLKLIMPISSHGMEFRTFCFCRNGYIVHGEFENLSSFNGVSNVANCSLTNFGLNLRINHPEQYHALKDKISSLFVQGAVIKTPLKDFIGSNTYSWDTEIYALFKDCLLKNFPTLCTSDALLTGPSFEYSGFYPNIDNNLKVADEAIFISGDLTGDFRGLLPALVSGYFAGYAITNELKNEIEDLKAKVYIKTSPTNHTKTIFTAQSKKEFYCKDAICEFVFNQGSIPVNPFQVFGYFLGDRVNRDLVRNGNNELISRCDELWVFGTIADGVLFEIIRAIELGLPVRFFTVSTYAGKIEEITTIENIKFESEVHSKKIKKEDLINIISQVFVSNHNSLQLELHL